MSVRGYALKFKPFFLLALGLCSNVPTVASNITFLGYIQQDNQLRVFTINVSDPATVDIRSVGYGGGPTDVGSISPGGFDTYLTLFDAWGNFIAENDDGVNAATDPNTGQAFDAELTQNLLPGTYALVLTQYGNYALGQNIEGGFSEASNATYTTDPGFAPGNRCVGAGFKDTSDTNASCRTGNYAIQFLNSEGASASYSLLDSSTLKSPVPEPGSFLMLTLALITITLVRAISSARKYFKSADAVLSTLLPLQGSSSSLSCKPPLRR